MKVCGVSWTWTNSPFLETGSWEMWKWSEPKRQYELVGQFMVHCQLIRDGHFMPIPTSQCLFQYELLALKNTYVVLSNSNGHFFAWINRLLWHRVMGAGGLCSIEHCMYMFLCFTINCSRKRRCQRFCNWSLLLTKHVLSLSAVQCHSEQRYTLPNSLKWS